MKATLSDGTVIEGTEHQIQNIMKALGIFVADGIHYESTTHGIVRISDMADSHIKNSVLKIYREWVDGLRTKTFSEITAALRNGPSDNVTLLGLVAEMKKRATK